MYRKPVTWVGKGGAGPEQVGSVGSRGPSNQQTVFLEKLLRADLIFPSVMI